MNIIPMKRIFFTTLLLLAVASLQAQKLKVESLTLAEGETIAEADKRFDLVKNECALLKVQMTDVLSRMEGNVIGDIVRRGQESWVYITSGSKYFRLFPASHMPMDLAFPDYQVKVKSGAVYRLVLVDEEEGAGMSADELFAMGMSSYLGEDYAQAVPWFEKAVAKGSLNAMAYLANMYHHGQGVERDDHKFFAYTEQAARGGLVRAQTEMYYIYRNGFGVAPDPVKAVEWLKVAADQNNIEAIGRLGWCYLNGWGVPIDTSRAFELTKKGAELGDCDVAMVNLALYYDDGVGVKADHEKAMEWLQKAARLGGQNAKRILDIWAQEEFSGQGVRRKLSEIWDSIAGPDE